MEFLEANWQTIAFVALPALLMAVINWRTKHYTEAVSSWGKWLLLGIDVLDVLRSLFAPSAAPRSIKVFVKGKGWVSK